MTDSPDHTDRCSNRLSDSSLDTSLNNIMTDSPDHTAGCSNRLSDSSLDTSLNNRMTDSHVVDMESSIFTESDSGICPTDRYEFETLLREAGTLESARKWRACKKNPGHPTFIPVGGFSMQDLPEGCQREEVFALVKCAIKLTVRLRVNEPDPNRPKEFTIRDHEGQQCTGTGTIVGITQETGKCSCADCKTELEQRKRWWCLWILTANHVVYNTKEAKQTMVDLFYDDETARTDGRMKTLFGFEVIDDYLKGDWSYVQCALHDENVAKELMQYLRQFKEAEHNFRQVPKSCCLRNTVVIVSHPHGRPKLVTLGNLTAMELPNKEIETVPGPFICSGQVQYTANTCPGSSGASVLWLGIEFIRYSHKTYASMKGCLLTVKKIYSFGHISFSNSLLFSLALFYLIFVMYPFVFYFLPVDYNVKYLMIVTVTEIVTTFIFWSLMFFFLRGRLSIFNPIGRKNLPHSIKFQKRLFTSNTKHSITAIDFGSTLTINVLQTLFLLRVCLEWYRVDTYWLSVAIIAICYSVTPVFIILLYFLFCKLEYHLLRSLMIRPRVVWIMGYIIIIVSACKLIEDNPVLLCILVLIMPLLILSTSTILIVIQSIKITKGESYLRTQTLSFVHSPGDENYNVSYICIFR